MLDSSRWLRAIYSAQKVCAVSVKRDKAAHLEQMAARASVCAYHNNLTESYKIVRILSNKSSRHSIKAVRNAAGDLVTDPLGVKLIWQSHFANVFKAPVVNFDKSFFPSIPNIPPNTTNVDLVLMKFLLVFRNSGRIRGLERTAMRLKRLLLAADLLPD